MRRRRPLLPFRGLCGKGEAWGAAGVKEAGTPPMGNAGKKGTHSTKVKFAACPGCGPGRDDKIATRYKRGKKENAPHNVRCAAWERQLAAGKR